MSLNRGAGDPTRCASSSSSLHLLLLLLFIVGMATATPTSKTKDPFDPSSFCSEVCSQGRGGNACQCSASKFVGKRGRQPLPPPPPSWPLFHNRIAGSVTRSGVGWLSSRLPGGRLDIRRRHAAPRWLGSRHRHFSSNKNFNFV